MMVTLNVILFTRKHTNIHYFLQSRIVSVSHHIFLVWPSPEKQPFLISRLAKERLPNLPLFLVTLPIYLVELSAVTWCTGGAFHCKKPR
jgi:hypothetical protein